MCVYDIYIYTYVYMYFARSFTCFDVLLMFEIYRCMFYMHVNTANHGHSLGVTALSPRAIAKGSSSIGRFKRYARLTLDTHRCKNARTE